MGEFEITGKGGAVLCTFRYCTVKYNHFQNSHWLLLRISIAGTSCQGHDILHCDSIGHFASSLIQVHANEGLCGCIGGGTFECPSLCLTCLRDVLKTPCRTKEKGRMKCVITEKKKQPTGWMTSLREAQGHCISMLTFTLWKEAYCQSYGKSCGAFTWCGNTHTHWWTSKLLSL